MSSPDPDAAVRALLDASRRFGRYEVLSQIGRGGMGAVYLARVTLAEGFEKRFALKVAHPGLARDPSFARRFAAEARLAARIDHPNVCAVVDFGSAHGGHYLVMEYLRGHSLHALLRRVGAPLPYDIACRVVCDAARGIHAAHELRGDDGALAGVVHRDLKPANLFVRDDGVTKVLDFGIARWDDPRGVERTGVGVLRGSSGYMAPEQTAQGPIDRRADVYALGVVLWEATVGRRLFRGASPEETLRMMREAIVPAPTTLQPSYPAALERAVLRCLARDPAERYATAAELADALESVLLGLGTVAGLGRVSTWLARQVEDDDHDDDTDPPSPASAPPAPVAVAPKAPAVEARPSAAGDAPPNAPAPSDAPGAALRLAVAAVALAAVALCVAVWAVVTRPAPPTRAPVATERPASAATSAVREVMAEAPSPAAPQAPTAVTTTAAPSPVVARPRPSPPRASSPAGWGEVNVMAWPSSAEVSEGGRVLGHTPIAHLRMPAGRHVLTLRPVDGGAPRAATVDVAPDGRSIVRERW